MHTIYFKRIWVSYLGLDSLPPFVLEENLVHFSAVFTRYKCKKLNSLKHPVRTTVAGSHN